MSRSPAPVAPTIARRRKTTIPPSFMLALWRLRKTWRLLIIAGLGNIAAVMLICVVPLFTQVALSAGLQGVLTEQPQNSRVVATTNLSNPSRQTLDTFSTQLQHVTTSDMGPYVTGGAMFNVVMPYFELAQGGSTDKGGPSDGFSITGYDFASLGDQISVVQGRLPAASATDFEIALTQQDAATLHAQVGSFVSVLLPGPQQPTPIQLHVVGIVLLKGAALASGPQFFEGGYGGPQHFYQAVTSNDALLAALNNPAAGGASNGVNGPQPQLSWMYQLDVSRITTATLGDVVSRLGKLQTDVPGQLNGATDGQGIFVEPFALNALQGFMVKLILLQIPILLLLVQVIALILLFVRMMAEMLVDYQADAISTLRSRGATRGQVFGAFTVQNIGLSLLALIAGPLAAIPLVALLASHTLVGGAQSTANALAGNPLAIAWGLRWYVLVAVVVSGLAMILSTNRAAGRNILTLRRESARATSKPFWQRLNLDLIFGILSLLGYVGYTFAESQVSAQVQLILSPLAILAALLLLVAAVLLFLRLLPLLLGLGSRLSRRGRGAATVLTFTQMSRAPRQPIRMTLLLALSTGFTIFTLILNASQAQRL
ncbi:MAG TPA: FtsX-like permease family protein, partial [Ktedonobacterales bacterium]